MTGIHFLWWWDFGQCVGELVVMRGDWGVTGIYFSWWWDLGQCAVGI